MNFPGSLLMVLTKFCVQCLKSPCLFPPSAANEIFCTGRGGHLQIAPLTSTCLSTPKEQVIHSFSSSHQELWLNKNWAQKSARIICMALTASKTGGWPQLFLMQMVAHHCLLLGRVCQGSPVVGCSGSRFKDLYIYFTTFIKLIACVWN